MHAQQDRSERIKGQPLEVPGQCYSSGKYRNEVQEDAREGAQVGVTGTPAFFINGRFLSGAQPFESFKSIIDDELER